MMPKVQPPAAALLEVLQATTVAVLGICMNYVDDACAKNMCADVQRQLREQVQQFIKLEAGLQ